MDYYGKVWHRLLRVFALQLLRCDVFLLKWRIPDVISIFIAPISALVCNYMPILITPVLSKVFERLISLRFGHFF